MPTVIEAIGDYQAFLINDRYLKPNTLRRVNLSLRYFCELYGNTNTTMLNKTDMDIFHDYILGRKKQIKDGEGMYTTMVPLSVKKSMSTIKSFVKRLGEKGYVSRLMPADVPLGTGVRPYPKYLTKQELSQIMAYLEQNVGAAKKQGLESNIYAAYMWRALIRFLYTTGLRNAEIRSLTFKNLRRDASSAEIIGKGNKLAAVTFDELTKIRLQEYLSIRKKLLPNSLSEFVFIPLNGKGKNKLSEQGLNKILRKVAERAGVTKKVFAHLFRHSLATHLAKDGWNIVAIRDKMRHSNVSITSIYTHSHPEEIAKMTESLGANLLMSG